MNDASVAAADGALRVQGRLDFGSVAALAARGQALIGDWPGAHCVIDLSGVSASGSAGLALLLSWLRSARGAGKTLEVRGAPPGLRAVAEVSGLGGILAPPADA